MAVHRFEIVGVSSKRRCDVGGHVLLIHQHYRANAVRVRLQTQLVVLLMRGVAIPMLTEGKAVHFVLRIMI